MHIAQSLRNLSERGDTIVEVLISIAVISMVLGGAFVTSHKSLQNTRDAGERSSALKLAESQLEQIKYLSANQPDVLFGTSVPVSYCLVSNVAYVSSGAQCRVNSGGSPTTAEPVYNLAVTRSVNTFTVRATWQGTGGSPSANAVELRYRAYQ